MSTAQKRIRKEKKTGRKLTGEHWTEWRRTDGTIDLQVAFSALTENVRNELVSVGDALGFLAAVETMQPITSRQAAAVALATAAAIGRKR